MLCLLLRTGQLARLAFDMAKTFSMRQHRYMRKALLSRIYICSSCCKSHQNSAGDDVPTRPEGIDTGSASASACQIDPAQGLWADAAA